MNLSRREEARESCDSIHCDNIRTFWMNEAKHFREQVEALLVERDDERGRAEYAERLLAAECRDTVALRAEIARLKAELA